MADLAARIRGRTETLVGAKKSADEEDLEKRDRGDTSRLRAFKGVGDQHQSKLPSYQEWLSEEGNPDFPDVPGELEIGKTEKKSMRKNELLAYQPIPRMPIVTQAELAEEKNQQVVKQGWLTKTGKVVESEKKRWFVLQGDKLKYFERASDIFFQPKGVISLDGATCSISDSPLHGDVNMELVSKTGSKLYFYAESEDDTKKWAQLVQSQIVTVGYIHALALREARPDYRLMEYLKEPDEAVMLDFSGTPMLLEAIQAISEPLRDLDSLRVVRLERCCLSDVHATMLSSAFRSNRSVTELTLSHNRIGTAGIRALTMAIEECPKSKVRILRLEDNVLGPQGATLASNALKRGKITELTLGSNDCGVAGAEAFAAALQTRVSTKANVYPNVKVVVLDHNAIGDAGAEAMSAALAVNPSITSLNMSHNGIGVPGATALAVALRQQEGGAKLTWVDLSHNDINGEGATALASAMQASPSLNYLNLSGNPIGGECYAVLLSMTRKPGEADAAAAVPDVEDDEEEDSDLDEDELEYLRAKKAEQQTAVTASGFALQQTIELVRWGGPKAYAIKVLKARADTIAGLPDNRSKSEFRTIF